MATPNGNGLDASNDQPAKTLSKYVRNFTRFTGTTNPRHLRAIHALMTRPITREHLDQIAGCSNGPDLVAQLRRSGLEIPCVRTKKLSRDLFDCWPGVYFFTQQDRRRVLAWLAKRGGAANA